MKLEEESILMHYKCRSGWILKGPSATLTHPEGHDILTELFSSLFVSYCARTGFEFVLRASLSDEVAEQILYHPRSTVENDRSLQLVDLSNIIECWGRMGSQSDRPFLLGRYRYNKILTADASKSIEMAVSIIDFSSTCAFRNWRDSTVLSRNVFYFSGFRIHRLLIF